MNDSLLHNALDWWASRDGMGGFATAASSLFPGWTPRRACRAPHREDRSPSFSLYRNRAGQWRFKDHATGEQGGLVDFVMLAGMGQGDACRWLMDAGYDQRPVGAVALNRPRRVHGPHASAGAQSQPHFHGCGLLRATDPTGPSRAPYAMSVSELNRSAAMADALLARSGFLHAIARARGWQFPTLRHLALEDSLGWHEGRLVMLYPTGAKKRFKPFDPGEARHYEGAKFAWMYGKPDSLWRANRITAATTRVHITEGETDAITLIDAGFAGHAGGQVVAVPGASCWREEWAGQFTGLHVTLWPDPDEPGRRLTARIIESLAGVAAKIETAALPETSLFCHEAH